MQKLKILNTRDIKKLKELLIKEFGCSLEKGYVYLKNEKNRVFIINRDISKVKLENLRVDRFGLYFAEWKNNQVRLSKEGSQLLVKEGKRKIKNLIELKDHEVKEYFQGNDLDQDLGEESRLVILKYQDNILGCAKYKEQRILNFLPKIHRREVII